jgi:AraC family transcriptional regulator, transcriptional activator of the genes for pyochelin and ferripyochelin receptors
MMKRMSLESKVLELVTLQFAQLLTQGRKDISTNHLQIGDIERIHQAKDTLIKNFDNPPSLMSLARQVGLNHYKLKVGFRHVFGTTVFSGYDCPTSFIAVATTGRTGTFLWARSARPQKCPKSNGSSYSTAFKKRFGVNPRAYRSEFEKN